MKQYTIPVFCVLTKGGGFHTPLKLMLRSYDVFWVHTHQIVVFSFWVCFSSWMACCNTAAFLLQLRCETTAQPTAEKRFSSPFPPWLTDTLEQRGHHKRSPSLQRSNAAYRVVNKSDRNNIYLHLWFLLFSTEKQNILPIRCSLRRWLSEFGVFQRKLFDKISLLNMQFIKSK